MVDTTRQVLSWAFRVGASPTTPAPLCECCGAQGILRGKILYACPTCSLAWGTGYTPKTPGSIICTLCSEGANGRDMDSVAATFRYWRGDAGAPIPFELTEQGSAALDGRRTIVEHMLEDHGVDHAQYYQGAGVAFSQWETVYVGCGDSAYAAGDDALEQAACDGWDTTGIDNELSQVDDAHLDCGCAESDDPCELNHYVAFYLKGEE